MEQYSKELLELLNSKSDEEIKAALENYHESDIADVIPLLDSLQKKKLFHILGKEALSRILPYTEDLDKVFEDISDENAADIVNLMDSDDAVDTLQELNDEDREHILSLMDQEARDDAEMILSYDEDEIGSKMTTNYVMISRFDSIKQAMRKLIAQAQDNDNITTILVNDEDNHFFGAVDLKDLICASKDDVLEDLILPNYPFVNATSKIDDCINDIRDYGEHLIPVVDENKVVVGVITSDDITEVIDEEMSEDYHKFAAVSGETDLKEGVFASMKKRTPWLVLLLVLGLIVSMLISNFEGVIQTLPVMVFFQSLILDMAGNSGTQSLAVTIRALTDEKVSGREKARLVFRELRVGMLDGLILGIISSAVCISYLSITKSAIHEVYNVGDTVLASIIVGFALFCAMSLASLCGTVIPMLFKKIKIDPAVASGPLITTINDVVAVVIYYGLTMILFQHYLS